MHALLMQPHISQECERSVHFSPFVLSSLFLFPPEVVDETGLGGWWLSLNDPVYFEKELIRALGLSQKPQNTLFARACAAFIMLQRTLLLVYHEYSAHQEIR